VNLAARVMQRHAKNRAPECHACAENPMRAQPAKDLPRPTNPPAQAGSAHNEAKPTAATRQKPRGATDQPEMLLPPNA